MQYIKNVLRRVTLPGAIFIAIIAVVPSIFFYFTNNTLIQTFAGTSILIMIGVALDTMSKIESQLKMYNWRWLLPNKWCDLLREFITGTNPSSAIL